MRNRVDEQIDNLVGALTDPIIVMLGGWGNILPDWIKSQITLERLAQNIKALKGEEQTATDAEGCAYLYTGSLEAPMDSDLSLYCWKGSIKSKGCPKFQMILK